MASVINIFDPLLTLDKCLVAKITGNYTASPEKTVLLYRLMCDGNPITPICGVDMCKSGEEIPINFRQEIECALKTTVPDCANPNTIIQDVQTIKEFTIQLGEIVVNNEECEEDTDPVDLESQMSDGPTFKVLNSFCNAWDTGSIDDSVYAMTSRPEGSNCISRLCRCTKDWIYFYNNSSSGLVLIQATLTDGTTSTGNLGSIPQGQVSIVPNGPCQIADALGISVNDIKYYSIRIGQKIYRTSIKKCCCKGACQFDLYFLEPKGGISAFSFDCVTSMSVTRSGEQICLQSDCFGTPQENAQKYGTKYLLKESWCNVTASVKVKNRPKNIPFMKALGASGHFYAQVEGADYLGGFISNGTEQEILNKDSKEISISGFYATGINSHLTN